MRLETDPRIPSSGPQQLLRLTDLFRAISRQVNNLSEGLITARHNSATAAPTAGTYNKGDIVYNSNPSELGAVGSKYVVLCYICVTAGTPGTWLECRTLTGN